MKRFKRIFRVFGLLSNLHKQTEKANNEVHNHNAATSTEQPNDK